MRNMSEVKLRNKILLSYKEVTNWVERLHMAMIDEELSKDTLQYSLQDIDLASNRKG